MLLLCACVHGVKSEISQVRNFAWQRNRGHFSMSAVAGVCVAISQEKQFVNSVASIVGRVWTEQKLDSQFWKISGSEPDSKILEQLSLSLKKWLRTPLVAKDHECLIRPWQDSAFFADCIRCRITLSKNRSAVKQKFWSLRIFWPSYGFRVKSQVKFLTSVKFLKCPCV